jgi:hypothetical protein
MAARVPALRAGRALLPRKIFWYSFLLEAGTTGTIRQIEKELNDLIRVNQIKGGVTGGACSTHKTDEKYIHNFEWNLRKKGTGRKI